MRLDELDLCNGQIYLSATWLGGVQAADGCANLGLLLSSPFLLCPGPLSCLGVSEHRGHILFTFLLCCHGMTTPSSVLTERANTSAPLCLTSSEFLTRN